MPGLYRADVDLTHARVELQQRKHFIGRFLLVLIPLNDQLAPLITQAPVRLFLDGLPLCLLLQYSEESKWEASMWKRQELLHKAPNPGKSPENKRAHRRSA